MSKIIARAVFPALCATLVSLVVTAASAESFASSASSAGSKSVGSLSDSLTNAGPKHQRALAPVQAMHLFSESRTRDSSQVFLINCIELATAQL